MKCSHSKAKNHDGKRVLVGGDIRVITLKYCVYVNYSRALTIKRSSIAEIFRSQVFLKLPPQTCVWISRVIKKVSYLKFIKIFSLLFLSIQKRKQSLLGVITNFSKKREGKKWAFESWKPCNSRFVLNWIKN